jgi:hypothetical protein
MSPAFQEFQKIPRYSRTCTITEKIDGTNACVAIEAVPKPSEGDPDWPSPEQPERIAYWYAGDGSVWGMWAGSRSRWITPGKTTDNHGFAGWVAEHVEELKLLGPGRHFGEWWGAGIQRRYGQTEKKFSLFNTHRWSDAAGARPACCHVVPVLYEGEFKDFALEAALHNLRHDGSAAAQGFMQPEGIVVYHHAAKQLFKKTLEKDESPKGQA